MCSARSRRNRIARLSWVTLFGFVARAALVYPARLSAWALNLKPIDPKTFVGPRRRRHAPACARTVSGALQPSHVDFFGRGRTVEHQYHQGIGFRNRPVRRENRPVARTADPNFVVLKDTGWRTCPRSGRRPGVVSGCRPRPPHASGLYSWMRVTGTLWRHMAFDIWGRLTNAPPDFSDAGAAKSRSEDARRARYVNPDVGGCEVVLGRSKTAIPDNGLHQTVADAGFRQPVGWDFARGVLRVDATRLKAGDGSAGIGKDAANAARRPPRLGDAYARGGLLKIHHNLVPARAGRRAGPRKPHRFAALMPSDDSRTFE